MRWQKPRRLPAEFAYENNLSTDLGRRIATAFPKRNNNGRVAIVVSWRARERRTSLTDNGGTDIDRPRKV